MRIAARIVFWTLLTTNLWGAAAGSPEAILNRKLQAATENYELEADNLLQGLAKFSSDFEVPIGIEWQLSKVPFNQINLHYTHTTVRKVLTDLVGAEPGYTLNLLNGVIHVRKVTMYDDERNFLNLPIEDFDLSSEYVFHANNRLRGLVVQQTNPSPGKSETGCAGSFGVGAGDQVVSFHLHHVIVRDILDKFVTSAGFNIWLVTFPEIPKATSKGFFESTSLFSPDLPDSELPAWDLLLPGYDPVRKQAGLGWKKRPWTNQSEGAASEKPVQDGPK